MSRRRPSHSPRTPPSRSKHTHRHRSSNSKVFLHKIFLVSSINNVKKKSNKNLGREIVPCTVTTSKFYILNKVKIRRKRKNNDKLFLKLYFLDKVAKKSIAGSRQNVLLSLARTELNLTAVDAGRLYTYGCWCGVGSNAGKPVDDTDL